MITYLFTGTRQVGRRSVLAIPPIGAPDSLPRGAVRARLGVYMCQAAWPCAVARRSQTGLTANLQGFRIGAPEGWPLLQRRVPDCSIFSGLLADRIGGYWGISRPRITSHHKQLTMSGNSPTRHVNLLDGPLAWRNWRALHQEMPRGAAWEFVLYSDAWRTGGPEFRMGPLSNGVRIRDIQDHNRAYAGPRSLIAGVRAGHEANRSNGRRV
jgi:hypothetical protein